MTRIIDFIKNWMLPIGMVSGALLYIVYHSIPALAPAGPVLREAVSYIQPVLLFAMLFLTFSRIAPGDLALHSWQLWLLLVQGGLFSALSLLLILLPGLDTRIAVEGAMLCLICPTATAAAVVTGKLGGDMPSLITYTILINLLTSVLVPLLVPLAHPAPGMTFVSGFLSIISKVFPLLICPCLLAWAVRYLMPGLHKRISEHSDWAFYIWGASLTLAIMMTTRSMYHHDGGASVLLQLAVISLVCCFGQFFLGKWIGSHYGRTITAGQSLGQKNTVFAIWMGYTFLSPVTSVAVGFYSIWHNLFNSWQLYRRRKQEEGGVAVNEDF